jgi:hypothetical protein
MYGALFLLFAVTGLSLWIQKRRTRTALEDALGHSVDAEQVMSVKLWMKVSADRLEQSRITPTYSLYSPEAAALAAFLGGFFGAGIIVGLNVKQQRSGGLWVVPLVVGFVSTVGFVVFAVSGDGGPVLEFLLTPVQVLGSYLVAEFTQGRVVAMHRAAGGAVNPWWKAGLIGLLATAIVFIGIVALSLVGGVGRVDG